MVKLESMLAGKRVVISVLFDTIHIAIHCGDEYQAQVVFEGMNEAIESDKGIVLYRGKE